MNNLENVLTVSSYKTLKMLPRKKENEIAYVREENKYYICKANEWEPLQSGDNTAINMGNLYEINKNIMKQLEPLTEEQINEFKQRVEKWNEEKNYTYLLYGKEISYFSLFLKSENKDSKLGKYVVECIDSIGDFIYYDIRKDYVEIWVKESAEQKETLLYLFNFNNGVIDY